MKNEEETRGLASGENAMITTASSFCYRIIAWIGLYHGATRIVQHIQCDRISWNVIDLCVKHEFSFLFAL